MKDVEKEIVDIIELEKTLAEAETEISQNEQFRQFLEFQKDTKQKIDMFWTGVQNAMIDNDIKKVSGDWGSVTVVERIGWDIDETQLPSKFMKKVPDNKKITDTFRLEGKAPKGCEPKYTKSILRKIK